MSNVRYASEPLAKVGLVENEPKFSTSWEGRFTPAGLTKGSTRALLAKPAGVNRPSQLDLFVEGLVSLSMLLKQTSLLTRAGISLKSRQAKAYRTFAI